MVIAYGEFFKAKYAATPNAALPDSTNAKSIGLLIGSNSACLKDVAPPARRAK